MKPFSKIAVAVFSIMAIVHFLRLLAGWEVTVSGFVVPVWWSGIGLVITAGLALMVWRESRA